MKVLITGASGFIGGHLVEALCKMDGYKITATGRSKIGSYKADLKVAYLALDLSKPLPALNFDVCIHAAGLADDNASESALYLANIEATKNLIAALVNCKIFIFVSSASVYNFRDGLPKKEIDASSTAATSAYGKSKWCAEQVVLAANIPARYILRPRAVYGKGDRVLLPRLEKLIRGKKMYVPGKLEVQTSLTNVLSLAEATIRCLHSQKVGVFVYNVADSTTYLMRNVFKAVANSCANAKLVSVPIWIVKAYAAYQAHFSRNPSFSKQALDYLGFASILDISAIQRDLNYRSESDFYEELPKFISQKFDEN